ncbi:UDP-N-acetylmuramoyl-L-alanyl-D-glutamate--2,6-diaminopimelate ligase [Vibrio diazotrophicus]|uniref:UDP-N-acetylmuramoyl-L-alanyl-D-glutamate--2, 6-diaminopimelate ligase n=1 Tax=Vibrio diazotrophicus TaxID=685 RepID=UPI0022B06306|nr:UDP-N-acetylmuramoyl-L-alanyl-D-glutamate--2,6-diaminopimelate ligase [Vibrio diazotrophicus]MCZ4370805.1 UDP-N-acetylmuramoyl-L-alanyl-D-glutamate--2,6-diaminopimelate ligase [Vibrio diazotrophicus]
MNTSKALSELISPWLQANPAWANISVTRLDLDSRKIQAGDTFVAIVGHAVDGRKFIDTAIIRGANAVLAQACSLNNHGHVEWKSDVPVIYIDQLDQHLSELAGNLYGSHQSRLVGVTGTNGKTTITQLIAQWIDLLGQKAAVMGTTGNGFLANLAPAANTTGSAIEIQAQLHQLAKQGADFTALEVSSHGLVQGRVKKLNFDVGVFSNLSRDHLDYHGTMEEYAKAKFSLFTEHQCKNAIINVDDAVGLEWSAKLPHAVGISLKSKPNTERALWATQVNYAETGITLSFDGSWGTGELHVPLIGEFNASNVMQAFATMLSLGFAKEELIKTAPKLKPVLGRMELFQVPNKAKIVVDYAHTPDALEKALLALRVHCSGKLWAIVGCGGDRDKGKRPMMASIAEKFADRVILTDDNPRSEDPASIVQDMLAGLAKPNEAQIEHSRYLAAKFAVDNAEADDIILLAGKGHEDYQVMAHETVHYSDRESAQTLLGLAL